ncbi:hypothetical protein B0H14DRAFT_3430077 [Mycena olivaceomarginata]|nr:hypothetical protein B0H14DRAFT_3430077 [Mycena olivaceomarginata]
MSAMQGSSSLTPTTPTTPTTFDTEGLLTIDPDEETPKPKPPTAKRVRRTRKSAVVATAHLNAPAPVDPAFTISALDLSSTASSPTIDSLGADTDDFDLLSIPPGFDQAMLEMTSDSGSFGFGDPWTEEDEESFKAADLGSTAYIPPMFDANASQPSPPTRPAPRSFQAFGANRIPGAFGMSRLSLPTAEPRLPSPLLPEGETMRQIFRPSTYFQAFVHPPPAPALVHPPPAPAPASTTPLSSQSPSISQVMSVASATQTSLASASSTQSSTDRAHKRLAWSPLNYRPVLPTSSPLPSSSPPAPVSTPLTSTPLASTLLTSSLPVPTSSSSPLPVPASSSPLPVPTSSSPAPTKFPESRPPVNPPKGPAAARAKAKPKAVGTSAPRPRGRPRKNAAPVVAADDDEPTGSEDGQAELCCHFSPHSE